VQRRELKPSRELIGVRQERERERESPVETPESGVAGEGLPGHVEDEEETPGTRAKMKGGLQPPLNPLLLGTRERCLLMNAHNAGIGNEG
jgi:hypothetical protein